MKVMKFTVLVFLFLGLCSVYLHGAEAGKAPEQSYAVSEGDYDSYRSGMDLSENGEYMVSVYDYYYDEDWESSRFELFHKDSSTPIRDYVVEGGQIYSIVISDNGEYIATGSRYYDGVDGAAMEGAVHLFHKDSSVPLWNYTTNGIVWQMSMSADGQYIAIATLYDWRCDYSENTVEANCMPYVYLFHKDSNEPLWVYTVEHAAFSVNTIDISADGEYIAASTGSQLLFFNKDSNEPLWVSEEDIAFLELSADGEYLVACHTSYASGSGYQVSIFRNNGDVTMVPYGSNCGGFGEIAFSSDGQYIVTTNSYSTIYFLKGDGELIWDYDLGGEIHSDRLEYLDLSADGGYLIASTSSKAFLFHKDSNSPLWEYEYEDGSLIRTSPQKNLGSIKFVDISANGEDTIIWEYMGGSRFLHRFNNTGIIPTAQINSITPSSGRFSEEFTFSGSGADEDGAIVTYAWISSIDGIISNQKDFSITNLTPGDHYIYFRAYDDENNWFEELYHCHSCNESVGGSDEGRETLRIYENNRPYAIIYDVSQKGGYEVAFNGAGTDNDGTIVAYEWFSTTDHNPMIEFIDSWTFLSDQNIFQTALLSAEETNHIVFRVQDNDGDWSNYEWYGGMSWNDNPLFYPEYTGGFNMLINLPPVITITVSPNYFLYSDSASVTATATVLDLDGYIVKYCWGLYTSNYLDEHQNTEPVCMGNYYDYTVIPSELELDFREYYIHLSVMDDYGDSSSSSASFSFYSLAYANAGNDIIVKPNATVEFIALGGDDDAQIHLYEWDFNGNGIFEWDLDCDPSTMLIACNPTTMTTNWIYNDEGTYTAVLRVTSSDGNVTTDTRTITVTNNPPSKSKDEGGLSSPSLIVGICVLLAVARRKR